MAGLGAGLGVVGLVLGGSEPADAQEPEPTAAVEVVVGPGFVGLRGSF